MAHSRIFGRNSQRNLTKYQLEMNEVAMHLCLQNPNLLNDRKALLDVSRKKLDESGYCYKKGKSRSKRLSSDDECSLNKRSKITKEIRLARIAELQEQIKDKKEQVEYKELRREAAKNVHNYKECDKLTEQISILKADRRRLELELTALTKKQKKSEWYFNKATTPLKVAAPQQNSCISWRLPSSSPEPQSPLSVSAPRTPTSSGNSFHSTPSPRVLIPVHSRFGRSPQSDDKDHSGMESSHESEDTAILSSDESSSSHLPPPSSRMLSPHESEDAVILSSEESFSQLSQPSAELPPPSSSELPSSSSQLHRPSLQRERAFWKPNELDKGHPRPSHSTSCPPDRSCSGNTPTSILSGQHFL